MTRHMIGHMVNLMDQGSDQLMKVVERVRNTAMRIARTLEPKPDMVAVELAALFHDMAGARNRT